MVASAQPLGAASAEPDRDRLAAGAPVLDIRAATLSYGTNLALDGVDLTIRSGEILALLGPNGAGKSSLMRLAAGRLAPASGSVLVEGRDPLREPRIRRRIGFVPQEIGLYPRLRVTENLDVFAQLGGLRRAARAAAVADLVERFALGAVRDKPVGALSGGFKRRVNLAASLVTGPRLILLDEPTQGVDLEARAAIHAAVASLSAEGVAVIVGTHDFLEAERLADRLAILAGGRILREGRIADLLAPLASGPPEQEAVLGEPPDRKAQAALREAGLVPRQSETVAGLWLATAGSAGGREGAALLEYLRARGVPVVEIRLRRAGLEALYRASLGPSAGHGVALR